MISDRHIATYQAGQNRIGHSLELVRQDGNYIGTCICDRWAKESEGTDESSKSAVEWNYRSHQGDE